MVVFETIGFAFLVCNINFFLLYLHHIGKEMITSCFSGCKSDFSLWKDAWRGCGWKEEWKAFIRKNEEGDEGQVPFGNVGGQRRNFLLFSFLEFMM